MVVYLYNRDHRSSFAFNDKRLRNKYGRNRGFTTNYENVDSGDEGDDGEDGEDVDDN